MCQEACPSTGRAIPVKWELKFITDLLSETLAHTTWNIVGLGLKEKPGNIGRTGAHWTALCTGLKIALKLLKSGS